MMPDPNAIDGLISRLHTAGIVQAMMEAERHPVAALQERVKKEQDRLSALHHIHVLFATLRDLSTRLIARATFSASPDHALGVVRRFVAEYNNTVETIRSYTTYDSEQRTAGILVGDATICVVHANLKTLLGSRSVGLGNPWASLEDIGIAPTPNRGGLGTSPHLVLDEDRFRSALRSDADGVWSLFAAVSVLGEDDEVKKLRRGVMARIGEYLEQLLAPAGTFAEREEGTERHIATLKRQIERMEEYVSRCARG